MVFAQSASRRAGFSGRELFWLPAFLPGSVFPARRERTEPARLGAFSLLSEALFFRGFVSLGGLNSAGGALSRLRGGIAPEMTAGALKKKQGLIQDAGNALQNAPE